MQVEQAPLPLTPARGLPVPLRSRADALLARAAAQPPHNQLLAALGAADGPRWRPQLEPVELPLGQVLCESRRSCSHVFFPTSAIISLLNLTANGSCVEVATVGNDGVVGLPLLMGSLSGNGRAVVQSPGHAYRLQTHVVMDEFKRGGAVMQLLLRYSQALWTQVAQTAVCNRYHPVDQQLCRLLLLSLDRVQGSSLKLTQEQLAHKLGVRRESVTVAALALQREGVIRYARGLIEVADRNALEARACECYVTVKQVCDWLLPPSPTPTPTPTATPSFQKLHAHCGEVHVA